LEKNLKERFGKLGLYFIEKAEEEIKKINQLSISQKADIKKKNMDKINESTRRLKKQLKEIYHQTLNSTLTSSFIRSKNKFLNLEQELIKKLRINLYNLINEKIHENYPKYITFLTELIKSHSKFIDKPPEIILFLNSKDYEYFNKNPKKIKEIFTNPVILNKSEEELIGGFKAVISRGEISYDYSIKNLVEKNSALIENEISKIVSDSAIRETESQFEKIIQIKKSEIIEHLKEYDRI